MFVGLTWAGNFKDTQVIATSYVFVLAPSAETQCWDHVCIYVRIYTSSKACAKTTKWSTKIATPLQKSMNVGVWMLLPVPPRQNRIIDILYKNTRGQTRWEQETATNFKSGAKLETPPTSLGDDKKAVN